MQTRILRKVLSALLGHSSKAGKVITLKPPAYVERHKGRDFLILAAGPSLREYRPRIQKFIRVFKPVVMAGNFIDRMFVPDYHAFVNRKRFSHYAGSIDLSSKVLLSPYFPDDQVRRCFTGSYEEIAFENHYPSEDGSIRIADGIVYARGGTLATILMGVAIVMGARNIYLAGLDGYSRGGRTHHYPEQDNKSLSDLLLVESCTREQLACVREYVRSNKNHRGEIFIITPTVYEQYYKPIDDLGRT